MNQLLRTFLYSIFCLLFTSLHGNEIVLSQNDTLSTKIAQSQFNNQTFVISVPVVAGNIDSVPNNISLRFLTGGYLIFEETFTDTIITFVNTVFSGKQKIFDFSENQNVNMIFEGNDIIYPEWWGATHAEGDETLTTMALEKSIFSTVKSQSTLKLFNTYYINDKLDFPSDGGRLWRILGPASIIQTEEKGIFHFNGSTQRQWVIDGINFDWKNDYIYADGAITTYAIGSENLPGDPPTSLISFLIRNISIKNCQRGIGQIDPTSSQQNNLIWSGTIEHINGHDIDECLIKLENPTGEGGGLPGLEIRHVYHHGGHKPDGINPTYNFNNYPVLYLRGVKATIDNIEVIRKRGRMLYARDCQLTIGLIKNEVSYIDEGSSSQYFFQRCEGVVEHLQILTPTIADTLISQVPIIQCTGNSNLVFHNVNVDKAQGTATNSCLYRYSGSDNIDESPYPWFINVRSDVPDFYNDLDNKSEKSVIQFRSEYRIFHIDTLSTKIIETNRIKSPIKFINGSTSITPDINETNYYDVKILSGTTSIAINDPDGDSPEGMQLFFCFRNGEQGTDAEVYFSNSSFRLDNSNTFLPAEKWKLTNITFVYLAGKWRELSRSITDI